MNKIGIKNIELERAEGLVHECVAVTAKTFAEAETILNRWALTAPEKGGGYNKCDFCVTFTDEETYRGRYDLSRNRADADAPTLREHILRHLRFYAGAYRNGLPSYLDHMDMAGYLRVIGRLTAEEQAEYAKFLETYDVEGAA